MTALPEPTPLHKPEMAWVPIDPETAARWLKKNTKNRKLSDTDINTYARDMAAGNWHLTGEAIKFAPDGRLLDGQHRLRAIIKSGVTITMLVIRNVSADAQSVMDTGKKRTASDALDIAEHVNTSMLAAAAKIGLALEAEADDADRYSPTHSEIADWIDANPDIKYACEFARPIARRTDCPPAVVAYTFFMFARIDMFDAAQFWTAAADKVGLKAGDPVIALTNRFAEARRNRERLARRTQISLIVRAWNTRRQGKTMRFIRVNSPSGGLIPIPEPR